MAERVLTNDAVTYYPNADERRQLMDIRREFEYMRTDPDFPVASIKVPGREPMPLTAELADVLVKVADQLSRGKAVFVAPRDTRLTTQEAADMLGMSRPTFVKLLEGGQIPFERVGRHRRVQLKDVEQYAHARHEEFLRGMDELASDTNPYDTVDNPLIRR
ncbi:helix-turn-helix domain-containing protein [Bifidobacterium pullorum]|uniref:helix-turn-helix domain-containing protein n=1 Tax=Bifidobacterium pullorum TaxID=78448 RepID=UPI003208F774